MVGFISIARSIALVSVVGLLTLPMTAADEGHEHELTEQQVGTVHFPVSCSPGVQKHFERAVALLHSFAFDTAQQAFRDVANDDPHCAMAHWGIAMTYWRWSEPDAERRELAWNEVQKARSLRPRSAREREYVHALAVLYAQPEKQRKTRGQDYSRAMEGLYKRYPQDNEAAAFYARCLIESDSKKAAAILEPLFAIEPNHPGVAHYLIHAYDKPGMAELGLPAARRYAQIAPAAPHALHMPSHIFARLGLWREDISSNLASIAASRNATAMHMGDEGHQFHAMEFLVYAYLQSGRESEAQQVIEQVKVMPKMNDMYGMDYDPRISALVAFPATCILELHDWKAAASLLPVPGAELGDSSITYLVRSIGAAHQREADAAEKNIDVLKKIEADLKQQKKEGFASVVDHDAKVAIAWAEHAEGKDEEALALLQELSARDTGVYSAEGELPEHEMTADLLMEMGRPAAALVEYEAELKVNPNRFNSLYGAARAAEIVGKTQKANGYYAQLVKNCEGSDSQRPELVHAREVVARTAAANHQ